MNNNYYYTLYLFIINQILCETKKSDCNKYSEISINIVRLLYVIGFFGAIFTSAMIVNQAYGLCIGLGTIDR